MPSYSRLAKKEEIRNLRKIFLFGGLTAFLIFGIIFLGIPALTKIAFFFSEIKNSNNQGEKTDILPPAPPKINSLPEATNQNIISISGFSEEGATIEIYINDSLVKKVISSKEGKFLADNVPLEEGKNEIYAVAIDQAGNIGQSSPKTSIIYDKNPPPLEIEKPKDGETFIGEKQRKITISGKTEPEAILTINDHLEVLDQNGNFSLTYSLLNGENTLKFIVYDKAENKTEKEIKVIFSP
jgi:hypothetical protein